MLGVEGEAQEIIKKYNAGIYFIPEDENDFIKKVLVLKNDINLYSYCVHGCGILAEEYDSKKLADKVLNILRELWKRRKGKVKLVI